MRRRSVDRSSVGAGSRIRRNHMAVRVSACGEIVRMGLAVRRGNGLVIRILSVLHRAGIGSGIPLPVGVRGRLLRRRQGSGDRRHAESKGSLPQG